MTSFILSADRISVLQKQIAKSLGQERLRKPIIVVDGKKAPTVMEKKAEAKTQEEAPKGFSFVPYTEATAETESDTNQSWIEVGIDWLRTYKYI